MKKYKCSLCGINIKDWWKLINVPHQVEGQADYAQIRIESIPYGFKKEVNHRGEYELCVDCIIKMLIKTKDDPINY